MHVLHGSNTSGLTGSQRGTGGPTTRVVDANRAAVRPQLVTDAAGRLHLAYARSDLQEIWYGTFAPGESWQTVSVDDGGIGNPSFRTETIRLTQGATSVAVPVGLTRIGGPSGFGFGFALDDGDVPHVGTALASLNDLRYASPGRRPDALLGMVDFATMDGTDGDAARAGQDYTAVSGTFTWMLGQGGGRSFDVPLIPDPARVGDHAFKVTLTNQQGFERLGACPELDIVVRNVPVGTLVSYFLPRSVNFSVNSAAPEKSRLVASGFFDMGLATTDLSGAATLFVGTKVFVLPALERRKNGSYRYAGQGVDFTITPNKSGSSRAKFRLSTTGDLTGRVSADGLLTLRFIQAGVVDGTGSVGLQAGRYKLGKVRGTLTAPALFVYSAKATVNGGGRDTLTLKTGLGALGGTPPTAPDVTVAFGSFTATVPGAEFTPRGESFVFKGDVGGVTSLVMDYARETMTLSAKGIDLGTVPEGAQSVIVTVGAGGSRTVLVRVVRKGNALRY